MQQTQDSFNYGVVPVTWRILEKNDGASVQLIYEGTADVKILIKGVIEGVSSLKRIESGIRIKSPLEQVQQEQKSYWVILIPACVNLFIMSFILKEFIKMRKGERMFIFIVVCIVVFSIGFLSYSIFNIFHVSSVWPPFGF